MTRPPATVAIIACCTCIAACVSILGDFSTQPSASDGGGGEGGGSATDTGPMPDVSLTTSDGGDGATVTDTGLMPDVSLTTSDGGDGAAVTDTGPMPDVPLTSSDGGDAGSDGAGNVCVPGCSGSTLRTCPSGSAVDQACVIGCSTDGGAHCAVLQPTPPVTAANLTATGVSDLVIGSTLFVHTDTGAIDGVRAANATPGTYEVVSGIGFALFSGSNVGVFTVNSLTVNDTIVMMVEGKPSLAVVSATKITLQGVIDARGFDAAGVLCDGETTTANTAFGPGGNVGVAGGGVAAPGAGGGQGGDIGGGGGGGFGGGGGNGGHPSADTFAGASVGGAIVPFPPIISGGFGGGASGGGASGGGGGAVQLVAGGEIRIGGGSAAGGVNVGGCGGVGAAGSGALANQGGGGGGSGGAILLQAPVVTMLAKGVLAANGGAGGSGAGRGVAGALSDQPALPLALTGADMGAGGQGSAGATLNGGSGAVCATNPNSCFAGGGGGGAGWIVVQTADGTLALPTGAIVSPSLGSAASSASKVPAQ